VIAAGEGRTALYEQHVQAKAKMISFAGWQLPAFYTTVLQEHRCVREQVGLFDVSHMGEFWVSGADAAQFLQYVTINDVRKLSIGCGQYTALCNERGGVVDDLILYQLGPQEYLLCVNAANIAGDFAWLQQHSAGFSQLKLVNASGEWSQIAIQGPNSLLALREIVPAKDQPALEDLAYTHIMPLTLQGASCLLARTGYTGEKGYELYLPHRSATWAWTEMLASKERSGVQPIGLGARDTLRLEAGYLLYGNDLSTEISPLEAGIAWATKLDGEDFIGRNALLSQKAQGLPRRMYCFQMSDSGIARSGMEVFCGDEQIGYVTSGSVLPSLGGVGGMALLRNGAVAVGDEITINIRNERKRARLAPRPLYAARVKD
jgi:aminomethyltransferase